MSKSTTRADLFVWAESKRSRGPRPQQRPARWAPRRRNGFAAALAVVVEAGKRGESLMSGLSLSATLPPKPAAKSVALAASQRSMTPPLLALAPAVTSAAPSAGAEAKCGTQSSELARCPKCGVEGEVEALFGFRKIDGKRRRQSWCRGCRRGPRTSTPSAMVTEAQEFARESVRAVKLTDLPLWSSGPSDSQE